MQTPSIVSLELGQNSLLAALPSRVVDPWLPHLESVEMRPGEVVYEPGATLNQVYFPTTAIVSLLYVLRNGASAEIAVVGYEGIVGVSLFMGGMSTPSRAVVQSGGKGLRLKAEILQKQFNLAGPVLHLLLRYTQALITQMAQTAVCNRTQPGSTRNYKKNKGFFGGQGGNLTPDTRIFSPLLYQLSYLAVSRGAAY